MTDHPITLAPLPPGFAQTREALHRLALHVVYLARREATGRFGLQWTPGGFGTPVFGDAEQVRVAGATLVHQSGGSVESAPITSLRAAAEFLDRAVDPAFDHGFSDVVPAGEIDADLGVDDAAATALGDFFGFVDSVLEVVRADEEARAPSPSTLWPEHFDLAFDVAFGEPAAERRVNVGGSPGDGGHAEPYLYVGPWTDDRPGGGDYWNAPFGATLSYDEIRRSGDGEAQHALATDFVRTGLSRLRGD
ncbi:hypothetical protein [Actinospongicola halichondriae]|uniref:hypothetical protein n=1 Tax=Actinospongicola halichondriae TaxID=3236844 RepID=UPI003D38306B